MNGSPERPRIAIAVPPGLRAIFFTPETWGRLESLATALHVVEGDHRDRGIFAALTKECEVVVTAWGNPPLDKEILDNAPGLRLLAHTGSSIKPHVTAATWERGVRITQAGAPMAVAVAEAALAHTLALLHRLNRFDHALRADRAGWPAAKDAPPRRELRTSTVGVIGASRTGRAYIDLVKALGASVLVYDPILSPDEASILGVRKVGLHELLASSRVVAVHAPAIPETRHMLGARELGLLSDEAVLVNTARSWLVDEDALLAELRTGRIDAGIDVFDEEPLPVDHPFRALSNVLLTPHEAGGTLDARHAAGALLCDEIERWTRGEPLEHEITQAMLLRIG